MKINSEETEIIRDLISGARIKIFLKTDSSVLATAQVVIGEIIEINGFTVRETKFDGANLWIQPPTHGRNYANSFFVKDKKMWGVILEKVEREYLNELEKLDIDNELENIKF